jgi:hypothetical protein
MCDFDSQNDPRSQIMHMKKIQAEGLELFIKKNADYGSSYKQYGLIGVLVRLQDKINRALHITQHGIHVKDESLRDTLIDLHNYAAMALMESEPTVPSLPLNENLMVQSLPTNSSESLKLTPVERAALPDHNSDPRKRYETIDAYEECNHRNINLRL